MTRKQLKNTLKLINNIQPYYCNLYKKTITKKLKKCIVRVQHCKYCLYKNNDAKNTYQYDIEMIGDEK